jgi:hypothetical protein
MYGVEPRVPGNTTEPFVLDRRNPRDYAEICAQLLEDLEQDRAAAMECCAVSAAAAKLRYDLLVRRDRLRLNDWILSRRGHRLKFMSKWLGPFRVHRVGPSDTYQLVAPDGIVEEDLVHRDRLKRCLVHKDNPPRRPWTDAALLDLDEPFNGIGAGFGQEGYDIAPVDARYVRHVYVTTAPDQIQGTGTENHGNRALGGG